MLLIASSEDKIVDLLTFRIYPILKMYNSNSDKTLDRKNEYLYY